MHLSSVDAQYMSLVTKIQGEGVDCLDRTGVGTRSIFGHFMRFNLAEAFPLVSVKKTNWAAAFDEMSWMLRGERNTKTLGSKIWEEWADSDGDLGPIYGYQWRHWGPDQVKTLIKSLKENPRSRRHILSAWNNADLAGMSLPPCHMMAQFYVNKETQTLSCLMTQRSCDVFLGLPFNIAAYAFLTHALADICGYSVGTLTISLGDTHLYSNHAMAVQTLITQAETASPLNHPKLRDTGLCRMINPDDMWENVHQLYEVIDYVPNKLIPAPVAV